MKEKKTAMDASDVAWESHLAAAWRATEEGEAGDGEESAALARRLDAVLRRERAARRAGWRRVWGAGLAAAACAALLAWGAVRLGRGGGGGVVEVAAAEEEAEAGEVREAAVAEAFEGLEEVLWEMAGVTLSYEWDDEDLESIN